MDTSMTLYYSPMIISLLAILSIILAYRVVQSRRDEKVGLGDGENKIVELRMRVHANLLENLFPFSILYLVYELNNGSELVLLLTGNLFLLARVFHAYGFSKSAGVSVGRFYGTLFSWLTIVFLCLANLYQLL